MKNSRSMNRYGKRGFAALALALSLTALSSGSAMAAGAHKWTPAEEESGPGVALKRKQEPEYQETNVVVTEEGQVIDTFNDVQALCRPGGREDYDPVYNCVVLVERYYLAVYGMKVWNEWQFKIPIAEEYGDFTVTDQPLPGDIAYMTGDDGGPHWFILKRVNEDGTYTAFEQNWKWVENDVTYATVNRRVPGTARDLQFFRRPGA